MKYKVGDKVRVRDDLVVGKRYSMAGGKVDDSFVDSMSPLRGKIVTIADSSGKKYRIKECGFNWTDEMFEPINAQKIVITTDGKETLARLYEGDKVIKSATAKCNPGDTFDFAIGAKLAFERLTAEKKKASEPKHNFKVGDRVKAGVGEHNSRTCDKIGTVIDTDGEFVGVEFDDNIGGHSAADRGKDGHCWYCFPENLTRIKEFVPYIKIIGERVGNIGEPTNYKDAIGRPLCIGDTVEHFDEKCESYGETIIAKDKDMAFVMGIKGVCNDKTGSTGRWKIIKKRSHEDVADGETVFRCTYVKSEK